MHEEYGDGSDHEVCEECGMCKTCGDCKKLHKKIMRSSQKVENGVITNNR